MIILKEKKKGTNKQTQHFYKQKMADGTKEFTPKR